MDPRIAAEARKMSGDRAYFRENYAKLIDFDGGLVGFNDNPAQQQLDRLMQMHRRGYIIKGRKMGTTSKVAVEYFHDALFTPNLRVLVAAHKDKSAQEIFRIYKEFYKNLPKWFKEQVPGMKAAMGKEHIEFEHGARIVCTTADSDAARGSTWQRVHQSEFCWYRDIERTNGAMMGSVPLSASVWRESTANGLNHGHRLWMQEDEYEKIFLPWMIDPRYVTKTPPKGGVPSEFEEYGREHNLSKHQLWWAVKIWRDQLGSNTRLFHQEFPATAELAFITSGDRFFSVHFPASRITRENLKSHVGIRRYVEPVKYRSYVMGVDAASGSKVGDFSTWYIMDVTDEDNPVCVSTFYGRVVPREFAKLAFDEAKEYGALAVIEVNDGYGLTVLDYFVENGHSLLYRRRVFDKTKNQWSNSLGYKTLKGTRPLMLSRLHSAIEGKRHFVCDKRLRAEINTFVYIDGKPQADDGEHDDMVMAAALAIMGIEQVGEVKTAKRNRKPRTHSEILQWELANGRSFSRDADKFDFEEEEGLEFLENDVLQELSRP